ncbi:MAG: DUF3656 domain-containing protein, partial [Thermoanaerobaculales bacterium]|nr:DUF3656 domain-containing protein [Thermoanaerobaculales bacterium]
MREVGSPRASQPEVGIHLVVEARLGDALTVSARCDDGRGARVEAGVVERARNQALDVDLLRASLGAFGGSGYSLRSLSAEIEPAVFVSASLLKQIRRRLVEDLSQQPGEVPPRWALPELNAVDRSCAVYVVVSSRPSAWRSLL